MLLDEADEVLIVRYRDGDVRAFEVLLARHRRGVYNFLRRYVGDDASAEDLLQETFLRVVRRAGTFAGESSFKTWLYAIARNASFDALRRGRGRKARSLDTAKNRDDDPPPPVRDPDADTEREAGNMELRRRLESAIARLPQEQREVLLMRERAGLSFPEIGRITGCSPETAKTRMRYALEKLRHMLRALADEVEGHAGPGGRDGDGGSGGRDGDAAEGSRGSSGMP